MQMRKTTITLAALLYCTFLFWPWATSSSTPSETGLDPERLARLNARMKSLVDRGLIAGAVTLVARHGVVASVAAVGYQEIESKRPMRTDSIFQIMSMTKPITSVAIMILVEEGKLGLTDPVEKYLPEFRDLNVVIDANQKKQPTLKKASRPITIRDLLTHTSGMPNLPAKPYDEVYRRMNLSLADAVTTFSQQPLEFEPGTKVLYSNPGIATVGRIIEVVSGQPYEEFVDNHILKPLGMVDSFFFPPDEKIPRIAMLYQIENGKLQRSKMSLGGDPSLYRKGARYPAPEFGMYSTARDLFAFYQMMLAGGTYRNIRILSRPSVEVMTTLQTGDMEEGERSGMGYGLAWMLVRESLGSLSLKSVGTYGHIGAFGTAGWVDPHRDLIGLLLLQGGGSDERNTFMAMAEAAVTD